MKVPLCIFFEKGNGFAGLLLVKQQDLADQRKRRFARLERDAAFFRELPIVRLETDGILDADRPLARSRAARVSRAEAKSLQRTAA
jgi:hypothetical protein